MPLVYPERSEGRAAFRRVIESLAQVNPVSAALANFYGYTHPSQFEKDIAAFLRELAETVNDHSVVLSKLDARLAPRATLSSLALNLAFYMLQLNTSGLEDPVMFEDLREAFADVDIALLEEAIAELDFRRYTQTTAAMGRPVLHVRPRMDVFLAFDLPATGRDTRADALQIARLWLAEDETRGVPQLQERVGWEPRRLNPALNALRPIFPAGRWSAEVHATLATTSVLITPEERFKLRQMVESGRVD